MTTVGILVHGRHVDALGWERLMWGEPPEKMGSLTRMVLEILDRGTENIGASVFGTGASERDGVKEAECMKEFIQERFDELRQFFAIAGHPRFEECEEDLEDLIDGIICDTESKNTATEVENAAGVFASKECTKIYQISCGSHIPRCVLEMEKARERGVIPTTQYWYAVADDMVYEKTAIGDIVVLEPPHRGDDPLLKQGISLSVIQGLFHLSVEKRIECLKQIEALIANAKAD